VWVSGVASFVVQHQRHQTLVFALANRIFGVFIDKSASL
jgi:hypothetical protein